MLVKNEFQLIKWKKVFGSSPKRSTSPVALHSLNVRLLIPTALLTYQVLMGIFVYGKFLYQCCFLIFNVF